MKSGFVNAGTVESSSKSNAQDSSSARPNVLNFRDSVTTGEARARKHARVASPTNESRKVEGNVALFKYPGKKTWWYEFHFAGQKIRESAKTRSKEMARRAENARRRELEESYHGLKK